MYQPKLLPGHIHGLYLLKERDGRPMTFHVRQAVERYLERQVEAREALDSDNPKASDSSKSSR